MIERIGADVEPSGALGKNLKRAGQSHPVDQSSRALCQKPPLSAFPRVTTSLCPPGKGAAEKVRRNPDCAPWDISHEESDDLWHTRHERFLNKVTPWIVEHPGSMLEIR